MAKTVIIFAVFAVLGYLLVADGETSMESSVTDSNYTLVWSDEFDTAGHPDADKWSYDVGDGCPRICGWGNNEQEYYTEQTLKNARVDDGHLIIEAHKETIGKRNYSSARLITKGKGDWTYGKIEVRAKNPSGTGTWPAIWMLPTENKYGGWPGSGEIDIMEHVGYASDSIFSTVHTLAYNHMHGTQRGGSKAIPDSESAFHVYGIDWKKDKIDFQIDGSTIFTFENEQKSLKEWPFDQDFHLILNLAVGGHWGGKYGVDDNIWPQSMLVDYVRVYKKDNENNF